MHIIRININVKRAQCVRDIVWPVRVAHNRSGYEWHDIPIPGSEHTPQHASGSHHYASNATGPAVFISIVIAIVIVWPIDLRHAAGSTRIAKEEAWQF